jgi:hypothetical protein
MMRSRVEFAMESINAFMSPPTMTWTRRRIYQRIRSVVGYYQAMMHECLGILLFTEPETLRMLLPTILSSLRASSTEPNDEVLRGCASWMLVDIAKGLRLICKNDENDIETYEGWNEDVRWVHGVAQALSREFSREAVLLQSVHRQMFLAAEEEAAWETSRAVSVV